MPKLARCGHPEARYAELIGLDAVRVADTESLKAASQRAFRAERPLLIETVTDPNVPPLPPELDQSTDGKPAAAQGDGDLPAALRQVERLAAG